MIRCLLAALGLAIFSATQAFNSPGNPLLAVNAAIQINLTQVDPTCHGYTNGTATVVATGGQEPYTYNWSNGQHGATNFGLNAGSYSVTVIDGNGESAEGQVTLIDPPALTSAIDPINVGCAGFSGSLVGSASGGIAPLAFAWSTGATTTTIDNVLPGDYQLTVTDVNGCYVVATRFVGQASEIFPAYQRVSPKCAGEENGSISVIVFGNYPPHTYVWENGMANQPLANVPAGDYGITVTNANGCTKAESVTLDDSTPLNVDVAVTNILCQMFCDGSVNAVVSGGTGTYSYLWNTGSTAAVVENLPPGWYYVTVTDGNGCVAADSGYIYEPPALNIVQTAITGACGGATGSVTVEATGGTPPYDYLWVTGHTGQTLSNVSPGTYFCRVTDANGCQKDESFAIIGQNGLAVTLIETSAECPGVDDGTVSAIVNPGLPNLVYAWNVQNSPNVAQLNGLAAGTVVAVTVTDPASGCVGNATTSISAHNQVVLNVTDTDVNCADSPTGSATAIASMGTAPYNYIWTLPNGTTVNNETISGLTAGAYQVIVTDSKGCTAGSGADVGALSNLTPDLAMEMLDCQAGDVKIKFNDNSSDPNSTITNWDWNIVWSSGSVQFNQQNTDSFDVPGNENGTVQLTVTSAAGCTATISEQFSVSAFPEVDVSTNLPALSCEGAAVTIVVTGDPAYDYQWSPMTNLDVSDPQNVIANPSQSTVYTLVVKNGSCQKTITVPVQVALPIQLSAPDDMVTCAEKETLTATAAVPVTYVWYGANGVIDSTSSILVTCDSTQIYTVVATDALGCSVSDEVSVTGVGADVVLANAAPNSCENTPVMLEAISNNPNDVVTYVWSSSSPNVTITPNNVANPMVTAGVGEYTLLLVATNQNGCTKELSAKVSFDEGASLAGKIKADLCKGLIVDFENSSGFTGTWSFGDSQTSTLADPTHIYASPGNYTVIFTPNESCVAVFDTVIKVLATPAVNANFGFDIQTCENNAIFIFNDSTMSSNGNLQWSWTFLPSGQTSTNQNPSITFTQQGPAIAILNVVDGNGCVDTDTAQVLYNIVTEELTAQQPFCPTETVELNPDFDTDYTYAWTAQPNDPNLVANSPNPIVSPLVPTTYTVLVRLGGCIVTKTTTVTPNIAASVTASSDQVVCQSDPVQISVVNGNGVSYVWSDNPTFTPVLGSGNTLEFTPIRNGVYYVQATTADGCIALDTVMVNNAAVSITVQDAQMVCKGSEVQLNVENNIADDQLTYQWSPQLDPIADPKVTPTTNTQYAVTVTNQLGCTEMASINVDVIALAVTATVTGKDTICPGESTMLLANGTGGNNLTYSWMPSNSLDDSEIADPTATPDATTTYTVTVTDENNCMATGTATVAFLTLECREPFIFVPKAFTPNGDGKNPMFKVRGANIKEIYFVVYDRWGEKMYETTDPAHTGWDGTYKGRELTPDAYGWYLRALCINGEEYIKKGDVTLLK